MSFRSRSGAVSQPAYGESGRFYKSQAHLDAARHARANDWAGISIGVAIDATELKKLQAALRDIGIGYERSKAIQAQSLNRAAGRLQTQLVRAAQKWTGIRRQEEIRKRMRLRPVATPGLLAAGVEVAGRHLRITRMDFGATWRRSWPGGKHHAWNRAQTAKGSFMILGGKGSSYGGGILFHRTSASRFPIKPLWGPNVAREMQRNRGEVEGLIAVEARWFLAECVRRAEVEIRRAKARYGL